MLSSAWNTWLKYGMCLLESDSHLIPWTLTGAKVTFHFVLEPQLCCLMRLHASVTAFQYSLLLNLRALGGRI